jgi:hypothetical protein
MNIQETMQQANQYFVSKILNGEYTVKTTGEYSITLDIEGFEIILWVSTDLNWFKGGLCDFKVTFTDEEKNILYPIFKQLQKDHLELIALEEARQKVKNIEARIASINN